MRSVAAESVLLRIIRWDDSKAWWPGNFSYTRRMLISILRTSGPMSNLESKRLIDAIIAKRSSEIFLLDGTHYSSMCHYLQRLGAEVEAIPRPSMSRERSPEAK